jgi:predicted nucleic-acid-binding Zn-ribbon protein
MPPMRARHRCPKCDHGEVLYVPAPRDADFDRMAIGGRRSAWDGGENGGLEAYVCRRCGYTELYVGDVGAIDVTRIEGARVLRAELPDTPYR